MVMTPRVKSWRRYLPEDEQLLLIQFVMRNLRMAGLGGCDVGSLHPEDEEVTEERLWYTGFREGDQDESCWTYTIFLCTSGPASLFRIR